jgi:hypothetical protein
MPPDPEFDADPDAAGTEPVGWLAAPAGADVLARVTAELADTDELRVADRLRREVGPERAAAVVTQARLRQRALAKFTPAEAGRMLFTATGLEQATRSDIAGYRAATVADRLGGTAAAVSDLGCGIGADLLAFARAGFDTTGVERDPRTAAIARANIAAAGLDHRARVRIGDATDAAVDRSPLDGGPVDRSPLDGSPLDGSPLDGTVVFADPARRDVRSRVFDPRDWEPPWPVVLGWLAGTAGVKVGPGIAHRLIPAHVSAEWISIRGRAGSPGGSAATGLKEAFLTAGALADPAGRVGATVQDDTGRFVSLHGDPAGRAEPGPIGDYLYEPDPAVIAAGLVGTLAAVLDGRLLHRDVAYLTADRPQPGPFARGYRVLEPVPHRVKQLRAALRARRVGRLTVKKRGLDLDPARLRHDLLGAHGYGDRETTLIMTRQAGAHARTIALLVEPL